MILSRRRRCAITGANGYVGSVLKDFLRARGYDVVELRRVRGGERSSADVMPFTLGADLDVEALSSFDVLIHCAYDFSLAKQSDIERTNVAGSQRVIQAASAAGVRRLVLISTMSAFDACRSMYGRAKLRIESIAAVRGAVIIRPGLVYGPHPGGMIGSLMKVVSRCPLIPDIGGMPLYLTHQDDLAELVSLSAEGTVQPGVPIIAASERPHGFSHILKILADAAGKRVVFIRVPSSLAWVGLKALETVHVPTGFRSDSLVSLLHQNPTPDFAPTRATGVSFRDFSVEALLSCARSPSVSGGTPEAC